MNELNLKILRILSTDGRKSFRYISEQLGKSPITIKNHIEEMEEAGIIKNYGIQLDYEKIGYDIIALIEITVSKGKMLEVEKKIANNPNVFAVYDITGTHDAIVLARFKRRADLSEMIKNEIHASTFVERTNTHIVLNVIKENNELNELLDKEKE